MQKSRPRILIVEDNLLIAMEVESLLEDCGCEPVGPVGTVSEALRAVRETGLDGALLDINLGDEPVWPVAELLDERGVPFVLASGYSKGDVPARFKGRPLLPKPVHQISLASLLLEIGAIRS